MTALGPTPLDSALLMTTLVTLLLAVLFGLAAATQLFKVRDPEEAAMIARRIGKTEDEVTAAADEAVKRSVRFRYLILLTAAFGAVAGLTD